MSINITDLDLQILQMINQPISPVLNILFLLLSYTIYGVLFLTVYYYYRKGDRNKFIHIVTAVIIGFIIVSTLKFLVDRPRPYLSNPNEIDNILFSLDPSFPSRHAFVSFLLLRFIPRRFPTFVKGVLVLYIFFIPLTMMYIGVHWPTDLLFGSLLGLAFPTIISQKTSLKIFNFTSRFSIKKRR